MAQTKGILGWFKKEKKESSEDHINGQYTGSISWENSLEISVEEMKVLYAEVREDSELTMSKIKKEEAEDEEERKQKSDKKD